MFDVTAPTTSGARWLDAAARAFPRRLSDVARPAIPGAQPVAGIWLEGRAPRSDETTVAVVGARAASRAGCARAADLSSELVRAGMPVVSGGALGIDAAAHRGALAAHGPTFAVLGCGIDVVYPDRHARLFREVAAAGGLISEYGPGVQPRPGQFPARNRLVAALAHGVLVGECRFGSGALITARLASALGRVLMALPGSPGADALIATGAAVAVASAADVRAALAGRLRAAPAVAQGSFDIRSALASGPAGADELAHRMSLPVSRVMEMLCEAELDGWIVRRPGGEYEVPRGH